VSAQEEKKVMFHTANKRKEVRCFIQEKEREEQGIEVCHIGVRNRGCSIKEEGREMFRAGGRNRGFPYKRKE
jgi:hypothetical protein